MRSATTVVTGTRRRPRIARHAGELVFRAIAFAILVLGAIMMLVPYVWMLSTSLKDPGEIFTYPPNFIPSYLRWQNYSEALSILPFGQWYYNTTYISLMGTLGTVLSASLVGFAFARLRAPGRDVLFVALIATMLLPEQVTMVPVFLIFKQLNWVDTWSPLIVPAFFGGGAFNVFLCRQFFLTLPLELDDAAKIDGCGVLGIYWRILLPLSKPVLAAVMVFSFVGRWNEFLHPVIYLHTQSKYVISIGLRLFRDYDATSWHWLMAASVVTMLPCLLIFFFAQKLFVQGIATTGIKG